MSLVAVADRKRSRPTDEDDAVCPITRERIATLDPTQRVDLAIHGHRFAFDLDALCQWLSAAEAANAQSDRGEVKTRNPCNPATGLPFDDATLLRIEVARRARITVLARRFHATGSLDALAVLLGAYDAIPYLSWDAPAVVARLRRETGVALAACFASMRQLKRAVDADRSAALAGVLARMPAFWLAVFGRLARPCQRPPGLKTMDADELCAHGLELLRVLGKSRSD